MRKKSAGPTGNVQGNDQENQRVQFILRIAIAAALGGFLFGYDTAVINGAVSAIQSTFNASAVNLGLAVSSALLGSAACALGAGWVGKRLFRNLPDDTVVFGYSHARWSPSVPTDQLWESIVELGYQFALGDNITVQPNLQMVFNPSGTGSVPDAFVLGMQMSFLF